MKNPETHLYTLWRKQRRLRVQLTIVIILILGLGIWLKPHWFPQSPESSGQTTRNGGAQLTHGTPDFKAFLPAGETIDAYGGWTRVSPSDSAPVYAYSATLYGTAIIVSQQKLPNNFEGDVQGKVQELQSDQGYVTQHTIELDSTTIYIGVSKNNYQSTIFEREGTLVLITSYRSINDSTIESYVKSLQ